MSAWITLFLSEKELDAIYHSKGFTNGIGISKSQALRTAEDKLFRAISETRGGNNEAH